MNEFIEAIVIGLVILLGFVPLLYFFCIVWMDGDEPDQACIEDMNPVTSAAQAGRPESL